MERLINYFLRAHQMAIGERTAQRLSETIRNMRGVDPGIRLAVTGTDAAALIPRRVDLTLEDLRAALEGRRVA
jgi:actin-like ATPase involved in cell morphogenesis